MIEVASHACYRDRYNAFWERNGNQMPPLPPPQTRARGDPQIAAPVFIGRQRDADAIECLARSVAADPQDSVAIDRERPQAPIAR